MRDFHLPLRIGRRNGRLTGTSMAAPHVTGAVARYLADHPGTSPAKMLKLVRASGRLDWHINSDPVWSGQRPRFAQPRARREGAARPRLRTWVYPKSSASAAASAAQGTHRRAAQWRLRRQRRAWPRGCPPAWPRHLRSTRRRPQRPRGSRRAAALALEPERQRRRGDPRRQGRRPRQQPQRTAAAIACSWIAPARRRWRGAAAFRAVHITPAKGAVQSSSDLERQRRSEQVRKSSLQRRAWHAAVAQRGRAPRQQVHSHHAKAGQDLPLPRARRPTRSGQ